MVYEANRIIKESLNDKDLRIRGDGNKSKIGFFVPFFLGVLITSLIAVGIYFIIR